MKVEVMFLPREDPLIDFAVLNSVVSKVDLQVSRDNKLLYFICWKCNKVFIPVPKISQGPKPAFRPPETRNVMKDFPRNIHLITIQDLKLILHLKYN